MTETQEILFDMGTGETLSARELGLHAFRWSGSMAERLMEEFQAGRSASAFPVAASIVWTPAPAQMAFASFYTATYLLFAMGVLRAPAATVEQFKAGIAEAVAALRIDDAPFSASDQENITTNVFKFFVAIQDDLMQQMQVTPAKSRPVRRKATGMLLDMLLQTYASGPENAGKRRDALSATQSIAGLIDGIPTSMIEAQDRQGIALAA